MEKCHRRRLSMTSKPTRTGRAAGAGCGFAGTGCCSAGTGSAHTGSGSCQAGTGSGSAGTGSGSAGTGSGFGLGTAACNLAGSRLAAAGSGCQGNLFAGSCSDAEGCSLGAQPSAVSSAELAWGVVGLPVPRQLPPSSRIPGVPRRIWRLLLPVCT